MAAASPRHGGRRALQGAQRGSARAGWPTSTAPRTSQLGRRVALKLLYRRFAEDEEFVERFRREASSAAGLQHPNVVAVFDRGEFDGTYYIAMEFLDGPLAQAARSARRRRSTRSARSTSTIQILRAARFAHRRGIMHRDIKPHNVIVDDEGRAKVTDFGIARAGASDMTRDRLDHGHRAVPLAGAGPGPPGRRARPTSTRSASCSTSC